MPWTPADQLIATLKRCPCVLCQGDIRQIIKDEDERRKGISAASLNKTIDKNNSENGASVI